MKQNESDVDRVIRVVLGTFLGFIAYCSVLGAMRIVLFIIALWLILTGFSGYCPGYKALKFSTMPKKSRSKK